MTDDNGRTAAVLKIGERFYVSHKGGRLVTAWSLAGAKLFGPWDSYGLGTTEAALRKKKREAVRVTVCLAPPADTRPWQCADCGRICDANCGWCPVC